MPRDVDIKQVNGTAIATNAGAADAGTPRVVIATGGGGGLATEATLATVAGDTTSMDGKMPADPAREGGNLATIAGDTTSLDAKIPPGTAGAAVSMAISAVSADMAADSAAGWYEITSDVDCYWDVTAAGGGVGVVWETDPAEPLRGGERVVRYLSAAGRIAAICDAGVTGRFTVVPLS